MSFLVIFDCDGVLVDSELLEHGVDAELLRPLGYAFSALELLQRFVGIARTDMYKTVFAELGREMPRGLLDEREKLVWERCRRDLKRFPASKARSRRCGSSPNASLHRAYRRS